MKQKNISFEQIPEAIGTLLKEVSLLRSLLQQQPEKTQDEKEEYLTPFEMVQWLKFQQ